jgi:hypothetical protein
MYKMTLDRPEFNPENEPCAIKDLRYEELVGMIRVICDPESDEDLQSFYIEIIDASLPGADVSDLIFWPNIWFKDESKLHIELSVKEIANYVLAWTEKRLPGSENIELPEIPKSKKVGPPNVIQL